MKITSSAFHDKGIIPSRYTCEGNDTHPPLEFHDVPPAAKSLVLLVDDPDVPKNLRADGMWDHWVVFNISPTTKGFSEGSSIHGVQGRNTKGQNCYQGPCPPDREHRYFFKLYALDKMLDLPAGCSKHDVEKAIHGHILAEAHLMGRYEKGKGY